MADATPKTRFTIFLFGTPEALAWFPMAGSSRRALLDATSPPRCAASPEDVTVP
jgi:hypothetical protein